MIKKVLISMMLFTAVALNALTLRIELDELSNKLAEYTILDVRDKFTFESGHIKGALNFPVNLTYEHKSIDGKITEPNKMQSILRKLGLDVNDKIVIYDDGTFFDASRLFWTLEVYGFKNVRLLNGGYEEWEELELPISRETTLPKSSNYIASIDNKKLATKFTTQIATKNPRQVIIDARDYKAYIGKKSVAKRFGHIPKAIHIPSSHNINSTLEHRVRLKKSDELQKVYKDIAKDKKIVIYCALGRIASTNYFALRELGYDVANYDASWKEWGNDFNLPIINPSKDTK
jgi:thiosulfate/3-mercaptopyruvate sulfurtransferase